MDKAKSLEIIQFLHRAGKTCTTAAIDNACSNDDLDIVQFLFHNRSEGCSEKAIIVACQRDNLELLKFLLDKRTKKCSPTTVDSVIEGNCSLDFIKLLNQTCTIEGLTSAEHRRDRLDILEYFLPKLNYNVYIGWRGRDNVIGYTAHFTVASNVSVSFGSSMTMDASQLNTPFLNIDGLVSLKASNINSTY
ncbi:hypothetical protein DFA_04180 [Cavenderia fasciculata]|uniref:Ankyrin repeat-containing protein n=1 Tax=Cavenderia fasciculata TaxID=261658 RepID=F4Q1I3_CACFS|nr:uncharacterized protein DFA_04180 [Cavenderia fasciculata]EGG18684.1 hypothetical protein DFA_04180 [Cavenderia fasciculata]|eukprot:XP_004366588.1 hypothetical protein DFA_04180 [Cavenderia fasciculata]